MKPVVEAFAFTFSFPGADEDYILLVYDALRSKKDSVLDVALDIDGRIHVAVRPVYSIDSSVDSFSERVASYSDMVRRVVEDAVEEANRRYGLLKDIDRIEQALSERRFASVLEDLVPSVW